MPTEIREETAVLENGELTENASEIPTEAPNEECEVTSEPLPLDATEENNGEDILRCDLDTLAEEFPELSGCESISEIDGALRYGELRELGLSPREAYLATRPVSVKARSARAHLTPAAPSARRSLASAMPHRELKLARELFAGLSDSEIEALYRRVNQA